MATGVGALVVSLALDAAEYIAGMTRAEREQEKLEQANAKTSRAIDNQVKSLKAAADTIGMSAKQATLLQLANEGATKAQLASARAALTQVEAYNLGAKAGDMLKIAIASLAVAAVAAVAGFRELINGAAAFQDLSDKTGASAQSLASLSIAASVAGVNMESVGNSLNIMAKNLTGVGDDSKAAGAALAALNIPIDDFKALDPVEQYKALNTALGGFADGSAKSAVIMAIMGKAGAEQLKVMAALTDEGERSVILTGEQIKQADAYSDANSRTLATLKLLAESAAVAALGPFTSLLSVIKDSIKATLGLKESSDNLALNDAVRDWAKRTALGVAALIDTLKDAAAEIRATVNSTEVDFARFKFGAQIVTASPAALGDYYLRDIGPLKKAAEEKNAAIKAAADFTASTIAKGGETMVQALKRTFAEQETAQRTHSIALGVMGNAGEVDMRPTLGYTGAVGVEKKGKGAPKAAKGSDDTKALFDNQLQEIERGIKLQQEALTSLGKFSDMAYKSNLVSIQDYYDKKQSIANAGLLQELAGIDREIAATTAARAKAKTPEDIAKLTGKGEELLDRRAAADQKYAEAARANALEQSRDQLGLSKAIGGVNADILELTGHLKEAAAIRFDEATASMKGLFQANDQAAGLAQLETLRAYKIARADFDEQAAAGARILDDLKDAEERVAIAQKLGAIGELQALKELKTARLEAVEALKGSVVAREADAKASGSPQLVDQAKAARLTLDQIAASTDDAKKNASKLDEVLQSAAVSPFADFISGAKDAGSAFASFANTVIASLIQIAAQKAAASIFGNAFFGSLVGGGSGAAAAGVSGVVVGGSGIKLATGTDYVPYDGFRAVLHQGERVVPRKFNPAAGGSGGGATIIDNSTTQIGSSVDRSYVDAAVRKGNDAQYARWKREQVTRGI